MLESILMTGAGSVRVELRCDPHGGRVRTARVALHRPAVARLLIGRVPEEAIALVRALHAVCGAAHRLAASRAIRDARGGRDPGLGGGDPAWESMEREALVELAFDHLCRLYIDWPDAIGLPVQPAEVAGWRRRLGEAGLPILEAHIDGVRRHVDALLEAVPSTAGIRRRLRRRARDALASLTAIKAEPDRPGKIRRIVTPAAAAQAARRPDPAIGGNQWHGEGRAFTARGELIHRVSLARDARGRESIAAWAIDAPTDRLFGPDGPVACALMQLQGSRSSLPRLARFVVLSFDPCVESAIDILEPEAADARDVARARNP